MLCFALAVVLGRYCVLRAECCASRLRAVIVLCLRLRVRWVNALCIASREVSGRFGCSVASHWRFLAESAMARCTLRRRRPNLAEQHLVGSAGVVVVRVRAGRSASLRDGGIVLRRRPNSQPREAAIGCRAAALECTSRRLGHRATASRRLAGVPRSAPAS